MPQGVTNELLLIVGYLGTTVAWISAVYSNLLPSEEAVEIEKDKQSPFPKLAYLFIQCIWMCN